MGSCRVKNSEELTGAHGAFLKITSLEVIKFFDE